MPEKCDIKETSHFVTFGDGGDERLVVKEQAENAVAKRVDVAVELVGVLLT